MTLQSIVETNKLNLSDLIETETLLVHPTVVNNTVEARASITIKTPDGSTWNADRVIKFTLTPA